MKRYTFLLLFAVVTIALIFSSCSGATYFIDNPTDEAILVSIDGKEAIKVEAKEYKRMDGTLSQDEHTMQIGDGAVIKFNLDKNHVMLNPTLSTYINAEIEYGNTSKLKDTTIVVSGKEYIGTFSLVSNDPFIYTGNINFMIDAPVKDEVKSSKGSVVMTKMIREAEFAAFYKDEYQ